jgi:cell fate regulator YaaT (PSP1 superfamily)
MVDREYRKLKPMMDGSYLEAVERPGWEVLNLVLVKADRTRKVAWFRHHDMLLSQGDRVVVETERGTAAGTILVEPEKRWVDAPGVRSVLRKLQPEASPDAEQRAREREALARKVCGDLARTFGLDLKLVDVEYLGWENRTVFYFTAEGRVDFRDLVKELSRCLRCRIEMRQIGPRDETKLLGGVGRCGREFCCAGYLQEFRSVRTKMAKEQGMVVNQEKITGNCRKLLCCLAYDRETYLEMKALLPPLGSIVETPEGSGKVVELQILRQAVRVALESGPAKNFLLSQVKLKSRAAAGGREEEEGDEGLDELGEAVPNGGADSRREERGPRRDERREPRRDDRGPRRDDRGSRRDDRGPGRDDRGPRRDDRGPRRDDRGPRRDERGPRRDDRREPRRDDRGGWRDERREPRRDDPGEGREEHREVRPDLEPPAPVRPAEAPAKAAPEIPPALPKEPDKQE